jgi:hypothetical protein
MNQPSNDSDSTTIAAFKLILYLAIFFDVFLLFSERLYGKSRLAESSFSCSRVNETNTSKNLSEMGESGTKSFLCCWPYRG